MGYILGNTRHSRNVGDTLTKKERAGGKGRQLQNVDFMWLGSCTSQGLSAMMKFSE